MRLYKPGVYFLFDGDELVYVGKSKNIMARIGTHIADEQKTFDSFEIFETDDYSRLEEFLIRLLKPKYNRVVPGTEFEHLGGIEREKHIFVTCCHDGIEEEISYEEYKKQMMTKVV